MGGFALSVDGCSVSLALREKKLLALLAVHGAGPRDFISGTLWPDTTQGRAAASLRVAVHNIRQSAPDVLQANHQAIGIADDVRTDLEVLRQCLAAPTPEPGTAELRRGLTVLTGGDLLPGWRDDWLVHERERMRNRRIRALAALAQHCLDGGDPETALAAARAAERLEPLRERVHMLAVQAMVAMGKQDQALAHHRGFVARLDRELGIRPSDQFFRLVAAG